MLLGKPFTNQATSLFSFKKCTCGTTWGSQEETWSCPAPGAMQCQADRHYHGKHMYDMVEEREWLVHVLCTETDLRRWKCWGFRWGRWLYPHLELWWYLIWAATRTHVWAHGPVAATVCVDVYGSRIHLWPKWYSCTVVPTLSWMQALPLNSWGTQERVCASPGEQNRADPVHRGKGELALRACEWESRSCPIICHEVK